MSTLRSSFMVAVSALISAGAAAQFAPNFVPVMNIQTFDTVKALRIADVAGSTAPDLLVLYPTSLQILQNQGFTTVPLVTSTTVVAAADHVDVGDLDGDGDRDILVASPTQVSILLRNGSTYLQTQISAPNGNAVRMADVDLDGDLDIVRGSSAVLASAPGVFSPPTVVALVSGAASDNAVTGDFDGDGDQDLAIIRENTSTLPTFERWTNNGVLPFVLSETLALPGCAVSRAESGDMNNDGTDDLCFLQQPSAFGTVLCFPGSPSILGGGATAMSLPTPLTEFIAFGQYTYASTTFGSDTTRPILADIDGNGALDVATRTLLTLGESAIPQFAYYMTSLYGLNNGAGDIVAAAHYQLGPQLPFPLWSDPRQTLGDLDGDGRAELVQAPDGGSLITVYRGLGSGMAPSAGPTPASLTPAAPVMTNVGYLRGIRVFARDASGGPLAGVRVNLRIVSSTGGFTLGSCASTKFTNSEGYVNLLGLVVPNTGTAVIEASTHNGLVATFTLNTLPNAAVAAAGGNQPGFTGQGTPYPMTVTATAGGNPVVGMPIRLRTPTMQTLYTGANGVLSFEPEILPTMSGPVNYLIDVPTDLIFLGYGFTTPTFTLPVWVRTFDVTRVGSQLNVSYLHEHGTVPLILTADFPTVTPVTTPAGTVYTSVLSTPSSAYILDSTGTFGTPPIPGLVANPSAFVSLPIPPGFTGFSLLFQMFAFDPAYAPDLQLAIVISNPRTVAF